MEKTNKLSTSSSDFGLYKEKQKENYLKSVKFVGGIAALTFTSLGVLYLIVHLTENNELLLIKPVAAEDSEITLEKPSEEKLILPESTRRQEIKSEPPKPFGVTYRGQHPTEFAPTLASNYPQLNAYRYRYYPKNIQDVIGYVTQTQNPVTIKKPKTTHRYTASSTQESPRNFSAHQGENNDPFHRYKPQEPGDVNLLATASFRFAPPIWSNVRQHFNLPKLLYQQENTNRKEIYQNHQNQKPYSLVLNIFPDDNRVESNRFGLGLHKVGLYDPRVRYGVSQNNPRMMVIHLNVYPELGTSNVKHHGDYKESRVKAVLAKPLKN